MEYEERVSPHQGNYIIASGREFEDILIKKPLALEDLTVQVGEMTLLHNWFFKPCQFVGFLECGGIDKAIFFLGQGESDLFSTGGYYYDLTCIIEPNRIGKSYREGSFRDCFLRKKNDKYYWK